MHIVHNIEAGGLGGGEVGDFQHPEVHEGGGD